jgi:multimeric flavodoxin WrbA
MVGDVTLEDFSSCDGIAIGSPKYFDYVAGVIKDFFDRPYEKAMAAPEIYRKPYLLFISAGNDGRGTRD